jgi:hypothetical protein
MRPTWGVGGAFIIAVLACGCGRLGFDADGTHGDGRTSDGRNGDTAGSADAVALAHDEDGDGIPDTLDTCPMTPDATNVDGDGDGVGDICDTDPAIARQHWLLFSGMNEAFPLTLAPAGAWTQNADDISYVDGTSQDQILRAGAVGDIDLWLGVDVAQVGTGGVQVAIIINGNNVPYYYGELFDSGSGAVLNIIRYDGASYVAINSAPLGAPFPVGPSDIFFSARTTSPSFTFATRGKVASTGTASYVGDSELLIGLGNHSGRVRYLGIVELQ